MGEKCERNKTTEDGSSSGNGSETGGGDVGDVGGSSGGSVGGDSGGNSGGGVGGSSGSIGGKSGSDMATILQALNKITSRLDKLEENHKGDPDIEIVSDVVDEELLASSGKTLNSLLNPSDNTKTVSGLNPAVHYDKDKFDPRCTLTVKAKSKKAVHISQFLHEGAKRRRQNMGRNVIIDTQAGGDKQDHLILHSDDQHPYAHITIAEWGAANCRVLNYLLQEGQIKRSDIEYYLAYTATINDFAEKYEWHSILAYDYEYRELQAEYGFNWGVTNPHLETQMLVPRKKVNPNLSYKPSNAKRQPSEAEVCKLWLAHGQCRFGDKCRYRHTSISKTSASVNDK